MRSALALLLLPALVAGAHAAEVKGTSRIDAVTVYPAGAEITRVAKVRVEGGDHVVLFTDLPARAIHSSIRVEGKATGSLEIGSVDSRRTSVPRSDDAVTATERKRVEDAIEKLKDERAVLQAAILAAEAQKAVLDTQIKMREVDRQITDLQGKLASLAPALEERTEVKIFVNAGVALDADIVIRYQIGGASWVPFYDARLSTGTKAQAPKLQLARRASIQQRTGEAWDNVALALSTARPGAGTAAPELQPVTIDYAVDPPPPPPRPQAGATRSMSRESAAAPVAAPSPRIAGLDEDRAKAAEAPEPVRAEETRARIDTQAFQAVYAIAGRVTVPETGEAKRVQIDESQLDPALMVRTVPKRDPKAYLYAKMTTARGTPILPGQVALFRDGTFVGNGRLPQLAPGEEHELGFGIADAVRVRHAIAEEKVAEAGILTSSKTDTRNYRITLKNLYERPIPVTVIDQIPVSQNADIKVELLGRLAPTKRDLEEKRGVLAWEMELKPDEEKVVEFGYRVTWPAAKKVTYGQGS